MSVLGHLVLTLWEYIKVNELRLVVRAKAWSRARGIARAKVI